MSKHLVVKVMNRNILTLILSVFLATLFLAVSLVVLKMADFTKALIIAGPIPILLPYDINFINLIVIFAIILLTPYPLIKYLEYRRKRKVELLMPVFLYDLAGLVRAGYTVPKALEMEAEKDLGPLTDLIRKAVTRITLGESVSKALNEAFKDQTLITRRFIETIAEAHESGGRAAQVLSGASSHAARLEAFEEEKRRSMKVYVSIIYVSIIVFMVSAAFLLFFNTALYGTMKEGGGIFTMLLTPEQLRGLLYYATLLISTPSCFVIGKIRSGTIVEGALHLVFIYIAIAIFYNSIDGIISMFLSLFSL